MDEAKKAERQRELEEKKARLEAYRNKRRLDKLPDTAQHTAVVALSDAAAASSSAAAAAPVSVESLLASVLTDTAAPPPAAAVPSSSSLVVAPSSSSSSSSVAPVVAAELVVRRGAASVEAASKSVETYVRTVQTQSKEQEEEQPAASSSSVSVSLPSVSVDVESAEARAARLRIEEERRIAARAETERRLRSDASVVAAASRAGELLERVLSSSENARDPLRDPRRAGASGASGASGTGTEGPGERAASLSRERREGGGAVVALQGSPHAPELALACEGGGDEGLVALWGLDGLLQRPLQLLRCENRLTAAVFVPWSPNLVLGASYGGALLLWDTRTSDEV